MVDGRLVLEYSKSARAACPLCGSTIAKDVVRLGRESAAAGWSQMKWHHPKCFGEHYPETDFSKLNGFLSLKVTDQKTLRSINASDEKGTQNSGALLSSERVVNSVKTLSSAMVQSNFHLSQLSNKYKDVCLPKGWKAFSTLILNEAEDLKPSEKVAAFDFDGTLVDTSLFRSGADAWSLLYSSIPSKLAAYHHQGYKLVIFTNESNIDRFKKARAKAIESKLGRLKGFMEVVKVPIQVFIACGQSSTNDVFRKPAPGMWHFLADHLNFGVPIDKERSFYVGDSAGRVRDHSDADIEFAKILELKFFTPEVIFSEESHSSSAVVLPRENTMAGKELKTIELQDTPDDLRTEENQWVTERCAPCLETLDPTLPATP